MTRTNQRKLSEARLLLDLAGECLSDVLLSLDTHYATQSAGWQEGQAGMLNCRASGELRERIEALRNMTWPAAEGLW